MPDSDIRHIAAGPRSDALFLTAEFEGRVTLWSLEHRALVAELDTVLDFGGRRLALCGPDDDPLVVAGAWERHGICAYSLDGNLLWQRKDLKRVQDLAPVADGSLVTACFDEGPMQVLAVESGDTVTTVRGVRAFFGSRFGDRGVGAEEGRIAIIDTKLWKATTRMPIDGFAVLSAASAPREFAVGTVGAASFVYCIDREGELRWRWEPPAETNCPALAWDDGGGRWVGILNHVNNEVPDTLVAWAPDGEVLAAHELGLFAEWEFLPRGRHLVTSDGAVRDTATGAPVWSLPAG